MRISDWSSDVCSSDLQGYAALHFYHRRPNGSPMPQTAAPPPQRHPGSDHGRAGTSPRRQRLGNARDKDLWRSHSGQAAPPVLLVISGVFSRHGGGDLRLGPQIEDLLADRRVADIITTVAAPADCVCRPAKAIFFAMVVDDAQPALVDKLINTGRAGRRGPGVGLATARNLRQIGRAECRE